MSVERDQRQPAGELNDANAPAARLRAQTTLLEEQAAQLRRQVDELEQANEELFSSLADAESARAYLARVIAQFPGAAAVYDGPDHVYRAVSAAYGAFIGGREAVGRPVREVFPELRDQGLVEVLDRVHETGEAVSLTGVVARWDATGHGILQDGMIDVICRPLVGGDGRIEGVIAFFQNVTERHLAEVRERVLARLGGDLLVVSDVDATLQRLADAAVAEFVDWAIVDVIEPGGRRARRAAMAHADPAKMAVLQELATRYPPDPSRPTYGREALATGRPQLYADVDEHILASLAKDAEWVRLAKLIGARSGMVLPLRTSEGTLGIAAFGSGRRTFTGDDLIVAEELGRRATLAIENARLVATAERARRDAERAAHRTGRLQTLSAALAAALTPNDVATTAVHEGVAAIGAKAGLLVLLDAEGTMLTVVAAEGYDDRNIEHWRHFPLSADTPLSDAVRTGEPVIVATHAERERRYPALAGSLPVRYGASMAVPLIAEGRSFGALGVSFEEPLSVLPEDRELLIAVAHQCAQAVRRATLFDAEAVARASAEAAGRRLAFLAEASAALASLDYEATLQRVARLAVPAFADYATVALLDENRTPHRVAGAHIDPAKEPLVRKAPRYRDSVDEPNPLRADLEAGHAVLVSDVTEEWIRGAAVTPEHLADLHALAPRSLIIAPLSARGQTLGVMTFVTSESGRRYGASDVALADEVARRAAVAVDNAQLYLQSEVARREAEAASRAKSEFLAVMSHELRTPLNAILGYSELVELGVHGAVTDAQREAMVRIRRSGQHLLSLVNNVLNLERAEAGGVDTELVPVPVADVFEDADALSRVQAESKGLTLTVVGPAGDVAVLGDRDKVRQVLANLLSNAVKFTPPGGRVTLASEVEPGRVHLRVRDTGVGIPPEQLARAFEPFVQLDSGLTRSAEGAGLGLAISRSLARLMGAELTAQSTVGEGSTFTLTLPRATVPAAVH